MMLCYLANAKSKVDISSGFETFFENIDFKDQSW